MTSPVQQITVQCPGCGSRYQTQYRVSINRTLDPQMDDAYVREMTTGTCPECRTVVELGGLIVEADGSWTLPPD